MLKSFAQSVLPLFEGLAGARSQLLCEIRDNFEPSHLRRTTELIKTVINDDVTYQRTPHRDKSYSTSKVMSRCHTAD